MAVDSGDRVSQTRRRRSVMKLLMALCLMSAIGMAGTTYESTLDTDPDNVIDVKHSWFPIGKEPIQDFKNVQSSSNSESSGSGGGSEQMAGCTDGIIGVLANLFPMLIPPCGLFYLLGLLLPFLVLITGSILGYRYRQRVVAMALAIRDWLGDQLEPTKATGAESWPRDEPANEVDRTWLAMVEQADIDRPWSRTPRECARAAVDAGLEYEAVDTISQLFVESRYGDAALTEERRQQARHWRERLDDGQDQHVTDEQNLNLINRSLQLVDPKGRFSNRGGQGNR